MLALLVASGERFAERTPELKSGGEKEIYIRHLYDRQRMNYINNLTVLLLKYVHHLYTRKITEKKQT